MAVRKAGHSRLCPLCLRELLLLAWVEELNSWGPYAQQKTHLIHPTAHRPSVVLNTYGPAFPHSLTHTVITKQCLVIYR